MTVTAATKQRQLAPSGTKWHQVAPSGGGAIT